MEIFDADFIPDSQGQLPSRPAERIANAIAHKYTEDVRVGFNQGSDARIAGHRRESCPYASYGSRSKRKGWLEGWDDVDRYWGINTMAHDFVRALPPIF
jgi:ribosome modulation factor